MAAAAAAIVLATAIGPAGASAAAPSPTPVPTVAVTTAPNCPMTAAAQAVALPPNDLPPPAATPAGAVPVGGSALGATGLVVPTGAPALPDTLAARSWIVADLDTGAVLGACAPHAQHAPASVQKLLLTATLMQKLDPKQMVTVTGDDLNIEKGSSAVGLMVGGQYSIETLWLSLLLVSGNDAANALARVGGGDGGVPATLTAMNQMANQIGARDTHAVTPSGLDGAGQFTSAYDLALIAKVVLGYPDFGKYAMTQTAQVPAQPPKDPKGFQIQNENHLITTYQGALGGKTGFTNKARHSYVGAAQRNGHRLVATLLDAEAVPQRGWQQGAALLDWGFQVLGTPAAAGIGKLVAPGELEASASAAAEAAKKPSGSTGGNGAGAQQTSTSSSSSPLMALGTLGAVVGLAVAGMVIFLINDRRRVGRRRRGAAARMQVSDRPQPDEQPWLPDLEPAQQPWSRTSTATAFRPDRTGEIRRDGPGRRPGAGRGDGPARRGSPTRRDDLDGWDDSARGGYDRGDRRYRR